MNEHSFEKDRDNAFVQHISTEQLKCQAMCHFKNKNETKENKDKQRKQKQGSKIQYLGIVLFIDDLQMLTRELAGINFQFRNSI